MRLLNVNTLRLEEVANPKPQSYAILSHTWGAHEVTFKDLEDGTWETCEQLAEARAKIKGCCAVAAAEGFNHVWIDTCCINKWSSSELSEAINSMFRWYSDSAICYAYLSDVDSNQDPAAPDSEFSRSRWFTRGWTLQELLAPLELVFFGRQWHEIGTKATLGPLVQKITRISGEALTDRSWGNYSVAQKMSWAAGRMTTRPEDMAYCLLGLFDINMALIYGEGERAFFRLQEEIMNRVDDESIFAWSYPADKQSHVNRSGLLAPSPSYFRDASEVSIGTVRTKEDMELGKETTEEYYLNTFELVRRLVRLRMPILGPLRGLELDPGSSHLRALKNIHLNLDQMGTNRDGTVPGSSPKRARAMTSATENEYTTVPQLVLEPADDRAATRPFAKRSRGMTSTGKNKHRASAKRAFEITPADEDEHMYTGVPQLFLEPVEGSAVNLLRNDNEEIQYRESHDEENHGEEIMDQQVSRGPAARSSGRSTEVVGSHKSANWHWFIYEPVIVVPLTCSIRGKHLGLLLSLKPKEGRALYSRVHNPSLVFTQNMIGTFRSYCTPRTLYAYGLMSSDNGGVQSTPGNGFKIRIGALIDAGYTFNREQDFEWLYTRYDKDHTPIHTLSRLNREISRRGLMLFEHHDEESYPSFYIELDFEHPVIGIFRDSTFPHGGWRVEEQTSRVEIPDGSTSKSIVLKWRQTEAGRVLSLTVERSKPGVEHNTALSRVAGGGFGMRLGLLMKEKSRLGAPIHPEEPKRPREVENHAVDFKFTVTPAPGG